MVSFSPPSAAGPGRLAHEDGEGEVRGHAGCVGTGVSACSSRGEALGRNAENARARPDLRQLSALHEARAAL